MRKLLTKNHLKKFATMSTNESIISEEILAQFQAKETTHISDEILDKIRQQIKKERIGIDEITNEKTKDILKKLGYSSYYEHISFIKEKLGIKPPVMTPELEEKLCQFIHTNSSSLFKILSRRQGKFLELLLYYIQIV